MGIGLTLWLINPLTIPTLLLCIVVFIIALYCFSIYCGILLIRKRKYGLKLSKMNQILQAISFSMFGYAYQYISGVYFSVGLDLTESFIFKFNFGISSWQLNINSDNPAQTLSLNLFAIFLIIVIDKLSNTVTKLEAEEQLSAIGKVEALSLTED
jgi:hypothetical protein